MKETDPTHHSRLDPTLRRAGDDPLPAGDDEGLIARVKARVLRAIGQQQPSFDTTRAAEAAWVTVRTGIERRVLCASLPGQPSLWRLAPGTSVEAHVHDCDEECLVLEGTLRIGDDLLLQPGDFHLARQGSSHGRVSTSTGALLYLRGAPADALADGGTDR